MLPVSIGVGNRLMILVENLGRINYNIPNDFKGIIGDVLFNNVPLRNWTMTGYGFEKFNAIESVIADSGNVIKPVEGVIFPTLFNGHFDICNSSIISDTYLDPTGWGKVNKI